MMFIGKLKAVHKGWLKANATDEKEHAGSDVEVFDVDQTEEAHAVSSEEGDESDSATESEEEKGVGQALLEHDEGEGSDQRSVHAEDELLPLASSVPKVSPSACKKQSRLRGVISQALW